jgi:hypothetical protein
MNATEFLALTEEEQFHALAAMTDDESRALQRSLLLMNQAYAYTRACDAMRVMAPNVTSGTPFWRERLLLETHYAKARAHLASPQHAHANRKP